ncbi:MAG TPA: sensor histidine kinase [Acidimicrobiales bacterium]
MDAPRVRTLDVVVAVGVVALSLGAAAFLIEGDREAAARPYDALAVLLVVVAGGALALHRRAPLLVLGVTTAALAVYGLRDYSGGPVYLSWIIAIFAVSEARGPGRAWGPVVASTAVVLVTAVAVGEHVAGERLVTARDPGGVVAVMFGSWAGAALLFGGSVRGRRAERAALEARARHLAETREEEARRRVVEERLRIARDLHDSVAHTMASISVQAGVGAHVIDERPEDARAALLAIKEASGAALTELRSTLGVLRSGAAAPREPAPGLDRLPSLVESSRAAGLPVEVVVEGEARPLPPAVETAAFRIVQESLTNVIRHAGPARATVVVRHGDGALEIEVTDDGRGSAAARNGSGAGPTAGTAGAVGAPGAAAADAGGTEVDDTTATGGHGLAGMRERVALLGGELTAGDRPAGGYQVRARIPW